MPIVTEIFSDGSKKTYFVKPQYAYETLNKKLTPQEYKGLMQAIHESEIKQGLTR